MNKFLTSEFLPATAENEEEVDLRKYLDTILNYKGSILGLTLIITIIAAIYVNTITPVYRATSTVHIDTQRENVVSIEEVYGLPSTYYEYYNTQVQIIKSRGLAERVIKDLSLDKHPVFAVNTTGMETEDKQKPSGWIDRIKDWTAFILPEGFYAEVVQPVFKEDKVLNAQINRLLGMLDVEYVENTELVSISFDSHDPNLAADLANALAEAYIRSGLESQLNSTKKAADWITTQLKELKQNVDDSERALQSYLDSEQLVDAQGVDSMAVKKLDDISTELVTARRNTNEVAEIYRQVQALKGQPIEAYMSIPAVMNDALVNQAIIKKNEADKKVSELEKRYGPKHPKMIAAHDERTIAANSLQTHINNVVQSLEKEYQIARAEESHLSSSLSAAKNEVVTINRKSNELKTLQHEVESNRNLYDIFLTRFKETTATEDLQTTHAQIVDEAAIPTTPYKPDKKKFVLIFFIIGLVVSIILVFIVEVMDNTLKQSADVENKLLLPVLSILPKLNIWLKKDLKAMRYFTHNNHSSFAENIRTIRTSVLLSDIDNSKKIILVTSSISEEGKSIVAVNLALALGHMGKTLLIDADMRKPSIAKVFGLNKKSPGLSHFMTGTHELKQCIHYYKPENLHVMPAGIIPSNPLELLSSKRFEKSLQVLNQTYDYIVLDSAPAVPVSDPIMLSQLANETIYVVKADATPYQLARNGLKKLQKVDANIIGVVLNMVSPARKAGKYGYTETDYYSYYGYSKS